MEREDQKRTVQVNRPEAKKPRVIGYAARIGRGAGGRSSPESKSTEQEQERSRNRRSEPEGGVVRLYTTQKHSASSPITHCGTGHSPKAPHFLGLARRQARAKTLKKTAQKRKNVTTEQTKRQLEAGSSVIRRAVLSGQHTYMGLRVDFGTGRRCLRLFENIPNKLSVKSIALRK